MSRIRILGPRDRLDDAVRVVQDVGALHLAEMPKRPELLVVDLSARELRLRRRLVGVLEDVEAVLADLAVQAPTPAPANRTLSDLACWARLARRLRRRLSVLASQAAALEEERALLARYRGLFTAFEFLLRSRVATPGLSAFQVVIRADQADAVPQLRTALRQSLGDAFEVFTQPLEQGDIAMLLLAPASAAARVDRLLTDIRVQEVAVPTAYGESLLEAMPRMREREAVLPRELEAIRRERADHARRHSAELGRARAALHDRLLQLDVLPLTGMTQHAFVLEGWLPAGLEPRLTAALERTFGDTVAIEVVGRDQWQGEAAPVALRNPRLFRPFEIVTRVLPIPRYGTIDPTPYVAVFFPMFFGLIIGDAGYGVVLAALALLLHRRSAPGSTLRSIAEVAGPCALFAIVFGVLFGEYFGDLGRRWLGVHPLWLDRESAIIPFLALTLALGVVHVVLGLVLGVLSSASTQPRKAAGRGLSAVMILLILVAILAAAEVLPRVLITPAVIALLVAFPILIALEGVVAPIELLSTIGHVLSYARIMALGTASVMLAIVANRMAGAFGSVVVGTLFALLFHLVNFALALLSPTIQTLRLHYVEFFGTFYSPGGTRYHPLGHWSPSTERTA